MKKRIVSLILIISMLSVGIFTMVSCKSDEDEPWKKTRVAADNLYSEDYEYIDYAEEVYYDTNEHPALADQRLYWVKWDENTKKQIEVDADTDEGAALVDPNKPTIIMVHGMMSDGNVSRESFYLNGSIATPSEFGLPDDYTEVSLARLWQNQGWNVGYYHYEKFTSQVISIDVWGIEKKIWSYGDSGNGITYKLAEGQTVNNATYYSIAQHFAADYIRAFKRLPDSMGDKEIRIAAHSMGGELITAGLFLLTELADAGQIGFKKLPSRFAMLDPFFSITLNGIYIGAGNCRIAWSGKELYENNVAVTMLECLKDLNANGIIIEYYAYAQSWLHAAMLQYVGQLIENSVYVMGNPDYSDYSTKYSIAFDGHNAIRDWYFCSIAADAVKNVNTEGDIKITASASTPTDVLRQLKGKCFRIVSGERTVTASDDEFEEFTRE